jgi:hypothetical protein
MNYTTKQEFCFDTFIRHSFQRLIFDTHSNHYRVQFHHQTILLSRVVDFHGYLLLYAAT